MAGNAQVHACLTSSAEPCGALPVARDDAMNENGCTSATRLSVAPREREQAVEVEGIALQARGIGHELNNLLAIITTYTLLVLEDLEPDAQWRPDLEEVCKAAERARDLARQLSALGRQHSSSVPPT